MSEIPGQLKFTRDHEWVREHDDGTVEVGITDHAQTALGDLVFIELPDTGGSFAAHDACCVVESVKAASDIYCPLAGTIVNTNEILIEKPELVNDDPYGEGWLFRLRPDLPGELEELLDNEDYERLLAEDNE
jgi:glycine cleavage system H protein